MSILFLYPDRMIRAYYFCPFCLFVCLSSALAFAINFEPFKVVTLHFGMPTQPVIPYKMTPSVSQTRDFFFYYTSFSFFCNKKYDLYKCRTGTELCEALPHEKHIFII